jgi:predicted nuclease of restriction endonuclease-like (RecB) superfamily
VESYWEIGEQIHKECGESDRAEYGKHVLKYLSERLTQEFGKGFSTTNLKYMRQFYCAFPKGHTLCDQSLSWSHYRTIMRVENPRAREFYVEECAKCGWSVRQLERQIYSFFYERLLASKGDESVRNEINELEPKIETKPTEILKSTYVLEFLELEDSNKYHEKELEQAIIDNLQKFLLELGRGFTFVARQKRLSIGGENFYIDLVFYNYVLKCFVLIDLKVGKITHQDIGQMQMYTNYYKRELMNEGDNQPIGLVLGAEKNHMAIEYTLPENNTQIFTAKYKMYLPTEEELRRELNLEKYKKVDEIEE